METRNFSSGRFLAVASLLWLLFGPSQFTLAAPTINSISPTTQHRSGYLEIFGAGFGSNGEVLIDALSAPVAAWTDTRIVTYVPETSHLSSVGVLVVTAEGPSNVVSLNVTDRLRDGRVQWRFRMEGPYSIVRPARGADGTVYAIDVYSRLYALAPNGALKWIVRGAGNKGVAVGLDGTVYTGSESDVKAFNPDGSLKWAFVQNPRAFIMLGLAVGPDGNIYGVGTQGMGVFSLTPQGALRWTNPELYSRLIVDYGEIAFGPNNGNDQLYFYANNHTRAVRLDNGASVFTIPPTGQPVVSPFDGTMHAKSSAYSPNGQLLWSFQTGYGISVSDVGGDGTTYFTSRMMDLYALTASGAERWHVALPSYLGPPNVDPANSLVVVGSQNTLNYRGFILGVETSSRTTRWRLDLPVEEPAVFNPWTGQYGFNHYIDSRANFSADSSTVYIITAIATGGLVTDRAFLYAIDTGSTPTPPPPPTASRLRSTNIVLSASEWSGVVTVYGRVMVKDANNVAVPGATVSITWTRPGGATVNQNANTDINGVARFSTSGGRGTYTLTVTNITKTGYTFDQANSVLSRSITR